jgi:hypothetical protein
MCRHGRPPRKHHQSQRANEGTPSRHSTTSAGAAAPPGAPPVPAAAPAIPVITFALSPGTTNPDQLIDYSTRTGQSLYYTGKSKLMDDEEEKFDLKVTQVVRF